MIMQKTIIGTGIFNLDTIVVREYPEWPAMRPFVEKEVLQEVGGTTLLRCTHKKDAEGNHLMSVRAGSPGGSRFPKRHFLRARDEAPVFLSALKDTPAVFFFDDPAARNRALAKGLKEHGSLVYFEPSRIASNADLEAVALSDIIGSKGMFQR